MPFVPDAVQSGGYFEPDEEKSVLGFGKNLVKDVGDTAKSLIGPGGLGENLMNHPIDTSIGVVKGLPGALVGEGKRIGVGELLTGNPTAAAEKFGNALYHKPLTTGMDVLPLAGPAAKMIGFGGEAAKGADLAAQASKAAEAAEAAKGAETAAAAAEAAPGIAASDMVKMAPGAAGKSATMEAAEDFARNPPKPPPAAAPPAEPFNPLRAVNDFVTQKYGQAAAKPGLVERVGQYLKNEAADMRGKDIGLQPRQIQSMGPGFKGLEKAEALMDYAGEKGYFKPGLTDVERKSLIKTNMEQAGQKVGAIRDIADQRGAPPIPEMLKQVKTELTKSYGVDAPAEIQKVLKKIQAAAKENPTFSGMSDLATDLNHSKTNMVKMGQHPGPTTDAANIVSRINNDAIRNLLNDQEKNLYTESLRDFGAHKKLEQMAASAGRKSMAGRSGAVGDIFNRIWQGVLDRGGYRMAGNVANRLGTSMVKTPGKFGSLPQFFEELAHHSGDVLDETLGIGEQGMAHGGIVDPLDKYLSSKYGNQKEPR